MNASFAKEAKQIELERTLFLNRVQVSDTFVATEQKRTRVAAIADRLILQICRMS